MGKSLQLRERDVKVCFDQEDSLSEVLNGLDGIGRHVSGFFSSQRTAL